MNPKQADRLRREITITRRTLAAEKRKFGGYYDSRGLRYLPTRYYVQLADVLSLSLVDLLYTERGAADMHYANQDFSFYRRSDIRLLLLSLTYKLGNTRACYELMACRASIRQANATKCNCCKLLLSRS